MSIGPSLRPSVIVVSRHRPKQLARCLQALSRQTCPEFEIILVADPASVGLRPDLPLKRVTFDQANISAARNAGLAQAAGQVVAFIDDDALARTDWLTRMAQAFEDPRVLAATGFTRGPDGLNWQSQAERITPDGIAKPFPLHEAASFAPQNGNPISTLGTNSAFRRSALLAIGGFDPAFRYFLDESDVNMRMAQRFPEGLTAVLPQAVVVHGIAEGAARQALGIPLDLTLIGRSSAIFTRRFGGDITKLRARHQARLMRLMVAGKLDPFRLRRLMDSFDRGAKLGAQDFAPPSALINEAGAAGADLALRPMTGLPPHPVITLSGWHWRAESLRRQARKCLAQGHEVFLLLLTPSFLPHSRILTQGGWWEQRGGLWGASLPGDSVVIITGKSARFEREVADFTSVT